MDVCSHKAGQNKECIETTEEGGISKNVKWYKHVKRIQKINGEGKEAQRFSLVQAWK